MSTTIPQSARGAQTVCLIYLSDVVAFDQSACLQEHYIPCYQMSLQDVALGRSAGDAAGLVGWLALLQSTSETVQVTIGQASAGGAAQVGCISVTGDANPEDDRAGACLKMLQEAQGLPDMDYCQLNFLRIPGLLFEGFWLKSNDANVPCRVSPAFFLEDCVENRVYTMPEFLAAMQPFAKNRLNQCDNSPL